MSSALNPFVDTADALVMREWYVSVGEGDCVGPVSADQIARAIRAGSVPSHARVVRGGDAQWEEVLSHDAVLAALDAL